MNSDPKVSHMFEPAFLGKVTRKGDIISRLNELHVLLREMPQLEAAERPAGFTKTAAQLISQRIMANTDKDMRLLSCCCIVDMFRISAPDIPYSDEECVTIFEALVSILRGLATCDPSVGNGTKIVYILQSLATVKTCVLPVILASSGVPGAEEVQLGMFHALVSSVHADHGEEISKLMTSVILHCLEESEEIGQELLDVLLLPLLPSSKAENAAAYSMVGRVLQGAPVNVQTSISVFLNQVLVGAPAGTKGRVTESELTDHIYPLIYEIHKLSPNMLLKVLPNVCTQLQAEEEEVRLKAVKLLGRLFASTYAEYGQEFGRNFREFVGRFVDVSSAVRLEMVDCSALIMRRKPALRDVVEKPLRERLRDLDAEVRLGALQRMIELAQEDPLKLSVPSFIEMGARVKDKRPEIRKGALLGMAQVYGRHIASTLPPLSELTSAGEDLLASMRGGLVDRLQHVPALVLSCWSIPEPAMRQQVLTLVQEYLLPRSAKIDAAADSSAAMPQSQSQNSSEQDTNTDNRRASALYFMFSRLDEAERLLLGGMLQYKSLVRKELQSFLAAREGAQSSVKGSAAISAADSAALKSSMLGLVKALPTADRKTAVLDKLCAMKDRNIFRLLTRLAQPLDSTAEVFRERDDVRGRVDSKSPLGEYVGRLCDAAGYLMANEDIVDELVRHAAALRPEDAVPVSGLLSLLAKHVPRAFSSSAEALEGWVKALVGSGVQHQKAAATIPFLFSTLQRGAEGIAEDENFCAALCAALLKLAAESSNASVCASAADAASSIALFSSARDCDADVSAASAVRGRLSESAANDSAVAVLKTMRTLSGARRLVKNSPRLACDLRALAGLLQYALLGAASPDIKRAFGERMSFSGPCRVAVRRFVQEEVLRAGGGDAALIVAGLRAWTATVTGEQEYAELSGTAGDDDDAAPVRDTSVVSGGSRSIQLLANCLWGVLETRGGSVGSQTLTGAADRSDVFEAAVSCALQLTRLSSFAMNLTVSGWKKLSWSLLNQDDGVQQRLARELFFIVQTSSVHLRFLVFPALLATDDALGTAATQSLLFNVRRLRRTHEVMSHRALLEESDEMQRKAAANMPENILPYVLYLLSYHPEFPSDMSVESEDDRRKLRKMAALVRAVVRVLVDSLASDENNIAFLLKQVNMVQAHYEDRHDKENIGLYFITRLATKILSDMVRTDDNVQEYRGDVSLPMELYQLRLDTVPPGQRGAVGDFFSVVQEGMAEAEAAMDRALGVGKKAGGLGRATGVSRKRSSGAVAARKLSKAVSPEQATESEGGESDADEAKHTKPVKGKAKVAAAAQMAPERDEGQRRQPRRQSMATVSYREREESEREAILWDAAAGKTESPVRRKVGSVAQNIVANKGGSDVDASSSVESADEEAEKSDGEPVVVSPKKRRGLAPRETNQAKESSVQPSSRSSKGGAGKQSSITAYLKGPAGAENEEGAAVVPKKRMPVNAAAAAAATKKRRKAATAA